MAYLFRVPRVSEDVQKPQRQLLAVGFKLHLQLLLQTRERERGTV
jgi:hypothetical protein